jgi:hypothetical protein
MPAQPSNFRLIVPSTLALAAFGCRARLAAVAALFTVAAGAGGAVAATPPAGGPAVNLLIEVRVIDEAVATGHGDYTVSTRGPARAPLEALQLQVQNGQSGAVQLGRALPVQWLQGAARGAAAGASAAAAGRAGAVGYAVTWVQAGQSLSVRPRWAGGDSPVTLELQFIRHTLQATPGTPLPDTHSQQAGSTLRVPLGVWMSFAATGVTQQDAEPGRVSTLSLSEAGRQLMQVRVSLP